MSNLFIPVIQGTNRENNNSLKVSKLITEVGKSIGSVETKLIDPANYKIGKEQTNIPEYTEAVKKADGFVIVCPEYNHSFPGSLKMLLDTELKNYIHKPVMLAGVSAGPWGGIRAVESLVGVVRELGMAVTFTDLYFPSAQNLFDEEGKILDEHKEKQIERIQKGFAEFIWMAKSLKWGRENLGDE